MNEVLKNTLYTILLLATCSVHAQIFRNPHDPDLYWIEAMNTEGTNYFQAIASFEAYWKDKDMPEEELEESDLFLTDLDGINQEMAFQYKRFRKWQQMHAAFIHRDGTTRTSDEWLKSHNTRMQYRSPDIEADWQPTGPNSARMKPLPLESRIGRMCQVKFHPHNPEKIYAISGSGGLFISSDNGLSWVSTGTDALPFGFQPASICIDHTDDQVLYLGMGDPNYGSQEHGVWKSLDGGQTWFDISGPLSDYLVYEILMSPLDHKVLIVATDHGIWKSADAGNTWDLKQTIQGNTVLDMKYRPGSTDTLYACGFSQYYRSIDGGDHWTNITNGIVIPGDFSGGRGMRMAVSAADPDIVYLGMLAWQGTVFKSIDGGSSFTQVYQDTLAQSLTAYHGIVGGPSNGNYNFAMAADPLDANVVYFGTQTLWKSTDGGERWTMLYPYIYRVHPDIHDLKFSPLDNSLWNINDGGIAVTADGGGAWSQRNDGMVAAEIYNGGQSPLRPDMLVIGTQDNGSLFLSRDHWATYAQGDIYDQFWFDYHTPDKYYTDRGTSVGLESHRQYNLNFPLHDLGNRKFAFTPADSNLAFLCQNAVWRCMNINSPSPQWTTISVPISLNGSDFIRDMTVSLTNADELFVLLANGKILHSLNARDAVPVYDTILSPSSMTHWQASITLSSKEPGLIYFTNWEQIFRSTDRGMHWTEITANLPDENITKVIHDDYTQDGSLYVLCGNRVYYRNDALNMWVDYSQGLPSLAYISGLLVFNDGSRRSLLRTVTYGRGIFETPLYKPQPLPWADFVADTTDICSHGSVQFNDLSLDATAWHWEFSGGIPSEFDGQTPPRVFYHIPGTYPVTLRVMNAFGEHTVTKTNIIEVASQIAVPYSEGFEGDFPPPDVEVKSLSEVNIKWSRASLGAFGESANSAVFTDSYSEAKTDLRFNVDLSQSSSASLTFDLAYGQRTGAASADSLVVLISTDCGRTFSPVYYSGGSAMATMAEITSAIAFNPGPADWRTETVDLLPFCGNENVFIYFRAMGAAGEVIALDNVTIEGTPSGTVNGSKQDREFRVVPNPSKGVFTILRTSTEACTVEIYDISGTRILRNVYSEGFEKIPVHLSHQPDGIYLVVLSSGKRTSSQRIVLQ